MPRVLCVVCGQPFDAVGRGRICSPDCRRARRRTYDAGVSATVGGLPPPMATCLICQTQFQQNRNQRICSDACRTEQRRRIDAARYAARTDAERRTHLERLRQRRREQPVLTTLGE